MNEEMQRELDGIHDASVVRRDCAFCRRERSRHDDNHSPACPYWAVFGGEPSHGQEE